MASADEKLLKLVYTQKEIQERVKALAQEIDQLYQDEPLVAVCVLKGACVFFSDLVRHIHNPGLELDFVRLSSYGNGQSSSRHVIFNKDVEADLRNKHVLIVEDIVDSGLTMRFLLDQFDARRPLSVRIAALLDKRERREQDIHVDFPGFCIPEGYLVGYGLDCAEHYRALPDIWELLPQCCGHD